MAVAAIPIALIAVATVVSAVGAYQAGQQQKKAYDFEAASAKQAAGEQLAAGTAGAMEQARRTQLELSANAAGAAGSGVNPSFGTPLTNTGKIAKYGTYNQLMEMYNAQTQATGLQNQASGLTFAGANAAQAGKWNAISSIVGGAETLYGKYGSGTGAGGGTGAGDYGADIGYNQLYGPQITGGGFAGGYG